MFKQNILIMLLVLLLLSGCGGPGEDFGTGANDEVNDVVNSTENVDDTQVDDVTTGGDTMISVPGGTLLIPDEWDVPLRTEIVEGENTAVTFFCEDIQLYTVTFSTSSDGAIGSVEADNGTQYVSVVMHEVPEYTDELASMQESVNAILEQLALKPIEQVVDQGVSSNSEKMALETGYGVFYYPAKWKSNLSVEGISDKTIAFYSCVAYHNPVLLFSLTFGEGTGDISTEMTQEDGSVIAVHVDIADLEFDDTWSAEEMDTVYSMQEELNYLLEELQN